MTSTIREKEDLIREWQEAYEAANQKPAPQMYYENGYFRTSPRKYDKYRKAKLIEMIATLRCRIS